MDSPDSRRSNQQANEAAELFLGQLGEVTGATAQSNYNPPTVADEDGYVPTREEREHPVMFQLRQMQHNMDLQQRELERLNNRAISQSAALPAGNTYQQVATVPGPSGKLDFHKPPVLDDRSKNEEVENWIGLIRNWLHLTEMFTFRGRVLTDSEKNRLVSTYLKGDPFETWQRGADFNTFDRQIDMIQKRYVDLDWMETKKQRFESMRQRNSARAFARDLQTLAYKLDPIPSDEQFNRRFRDGLKANVREAMDTQLIRPADVSSETYMVRAMAYDEVFFKQHRRHEEEKLNAMPTEQLNAMNDKKGKGKAGQGKGKKGKGTGNKDRSKVTCYGCNQTGHYKNECPSKK